MKLIYRIARLELCILFYSPIAWLVMIIFTLQSGVKFIDLLKDRVDYIQRGVALNKLTFSIFSAANSNYLFHSVIDNLYLYIPLITMGLISKELSSGSIKLLLSSPINFPKIVIGKYLAMVTYGLILCVVLGFFMLAGGYAISSFDYGLVLSGILGLFLLICSYSAIGLFISSLTSYQVVAAIGTFAVIALLNFIGNLWQNVPVINEIVYWLSMSGRADQMISGLISSKGILYFLIVILLFVSVTIMKLSSGKNSISPLIKTGRYGLVILAAMLLGYITSRPTLTIYYDMTATQSQTLTRESQKVVKLLREHPLTMTTYVNIFSAMIDESGLPKHHNKNFRQLENYVRFLPHLKMDYVYFYDTIPSNPDIYKNNPGLSAKELGQKVAASYGLKFEDVLSPDEIKERIDLSAENNQYVRHLEYNGKTTFLRMFDDFEHYPSQKEISSALKKLVTNPPKVAFVSGRGERNFAKNDWDYRYAITARETNRNSLINNGFNVSKLILEDQIVQDDLVTLVIADPKMAYNQKEMEKIIQYIEKGGNLLIMAEPDNRIHLEPLMEYLGIQFVPGQLTQENKDFLPDFILGEVPESALILSPSNNLKAHIDRKIPVSMPGAMGLKYQENGKFHIIPLIVTNKSTSNSLENNDPEDVYTLTAFENQNKKGLPIAVALQRKIQNKTQRIVVAGDADFMSNVEYSRRNVYTMNRKAFILGLFRWLSNDTSPVNADYHLGNDNQIKIGAKDIQWLRVIFLGILPGLILALGSLILIMRKRK